MGVGAGETRRWASVARPNEKLRREEERKERGGENGDEEEGSKQTKEKKTPSEGQLGEERKRGDGGEGERARCHCWHLCLSYCVV